MEAEDISQPNLPRTCHRTWLRMLKLMAMVMVVMIKWSKDHLLKDQANLQSILPPYTPKKDEFPLIVLVIVETFS